MALPANEIRIKAPRWRDRTILVAPWKVQYKNTIIIEAKRRDGSLFYPEPIVVWGATIGKCPKTPIQTRTGNTVLMHVVKLDDILENTPWLEPREPGTTPSTKTQNLPGVSVAPKKAKNPLPNQMKLLE
jgi:hypothetical protein